MHKVLETLFNSLPALRIGTTTLSLEGASDGDVLVYSAGSVAFVPGSSGLVSSVPSGAAGGDLGGTYPNPTVVDLTISGESHGDILYRSSSAWVRLAAHAGTYLRSNGAAPPSWESERVKLQVAAVQTTPLAAVTATSTTLTFNAVGAVPTVDGFSVSGVGVGCRVLVAGQADPIQNGLYAVSVVGDGSTQAVYTRTVDGDEASDLHPGVSCYVQNGDVYAGHVFTIVNANPPTPGTNAQTWRCLGGRDRVLHPDGATAYPYTIDSLHAQTLLLYDSTDVAEGNGGILLPASPYKGWKVRIQDAQGSLATLPFTVDGNGASIAQVGVGLAGTWSYLGSGYNVAGGWVEFKYDGTYWWVTALDEGTRPPPSLPVATFGVDTIATTPGVTVVTFPFRPGDYDNLKHVVLSALLSTVTSGTVRVTLYNVSDSVAVEIGGSGVTYIGTSSTSPTAVDSEDLVGAVGFDSANEKTYRLAVYTTNASYQASLHFAELKLG